MIGFEFTNNVAEETLAIAKLQQELMMDASKYDSDNGKSVDHDIDSCDTDNYDSGLSDVMDVFAEKNATPMLAVKRTYEGTLLTSGAARRHHQQTFVEFAARQSRLPLYLDSHNSAGEGERFQDICASMTATQFNGLNNRDGGGGYGNDSTLDTAQIKQPLADNQDFNALPPSQSLFCVLASVAVAPVGGAAHIDLSPSHVWQLHRASQHNASYASHVNHPDSNHFGPPHWQSVYGDDSTSTKTTTTATSTIKRKCLFKRAFSDASLQQQQRDQQRNASSAFVGLMRCFMPDQSAVPSRARLAAVGEAAREAENARLLSPQSRDVFRSSGFFAYNLDNAKQTQNFRQQSSEQQNNNNTFDQQQQRDEQQWMASGGDDDSAALPLPLVFFSGTSSCFSADDNKTPPSSLPLPPYCGCGCSGSVSSCFAEDSSLKSDSDDELKYYVVATKRKRHAPTTLTAEADINSSDNVSPIQLPSSLLTPALTPQSIHSSASAEPNHYQTALVTDGWSPIASSSAPSSPYESAQHIEPVSACNWCKWIDNIVLEVRSEITSESNNSAAEAELSASPGGRSPLSVSSSNMTLSPHSSSSSLSSSSLSSSSMSSSSAAAQIPPITQRAKKYSLCALSHEALAERKKRQNRIAAQRYRSKRTQTLEEGRQEIVALEEQNVKMRAREREMLAEIARLKSVLGLTPKS